MENRSFAIRSWALDENAAKIKKLYIILLKKNVHWHRNWCNSSTVLSEQERLLVVSLESLSPKLASSHITAATSRNMFHARVQRFSPVKRQDKWHFPAFISQSFISGHDLARCVQISTKPSASFFHPVSNTTLTKTPLTKMLCWFRDGKSFICLI